MTDCDLKQAFLSLRDEFLEITRGRIAVIERNWPTIFSRSADDNPSEALEFVKREAHTIAGSSGTYGYAEVSKTARNLESFCAMLMEGGDGSIDETRQDELASVVTSLLEESSRMFADPGIGEIPF